MKIFKRKLMGSVRQSSLIGFNTTAGYGIFLYSPLTVEKRTKDR